MTPHSQSQMAVGLHRNHAFARAPKFPSTCCLSLSVRITGGVKRDRLLHKLDASVRSTVRHNNKTGRHMTFPSSCVQLVLIQNLLSGSVVLYTSLRHELAKVRHRLHLQGDSKAKRTRNMTKYSIRVWIAMVVCQLVFGFSVPWQPPKLMAAWTSTFERYYGEEGLTRRRHDRPELEAVPVTSVY